ncbi:MAG: DNA mismatch repair endonuclease MutH [Proteobacteria bacterium]|nr:DNA mismatch repair endonuclease MutH [Pseudomonadota bacterium]
MSTYSATPPPRSEKTLIDNADRLAGKTLRQIAYEMGLTVPADQSHAKGWIGELMELCLGATASSRPEPDFQYIGVELKTLPINHIGKPKESTYVCTVPLTVEADISWSGSVVKRKLSRVLWLPVEADASIEFAQRRIGSAFLWSPDAQQETDLRTDWQELMDMIHMGEIDKISSQHGKVLQIRPKAVNARALTKTATATGEPGFTLPRGFYLRTSFTHNLLTMYAG